MNAKTKRTWILLVIGLAIIILVGVWSYYDRKWTDRCRYMDLYGQDYVDNYDIGGKAYADRQRYKEMDRQR